MTLVELQSAADGPLRLPTLADLRQFVKWTLCRQEHLDPGQFTVSEVPLVRAGKPCGLSFRLRGPRAVTLLAIWATEERKLYFYDSAGQRFLKARVEIDHT